MTPTISTEAPVTLAALAREAGLPEVALRGPLAAELLRRAGVVAVTVGGVRVVMPEHLAQARAVLQDLARRVGGGR